HQTRRGRVLGRRPRHRRGDRSGRRDTRERRRAVQCRPFGPRWRNEEDMMSVLVAYATKHGATHGIAERIAERLRAAGLDAEVRSITDAPDPARYDAVVLGSAAYLGSWQTEATAFARRHRAALADRPVWLF